MRPVTYDPLHNPFQNRFNYPVTCRRDEMQSDAYKVLLRDWNQGNYRTQTNSTVSPSSMNLSSMKPSLIGAKQIGAKQKATGLDAFNPAQSDVFDPARSDAFDPAHWGRLFASGMVLFLLLLASWAVLRAF